LRAVQLAIAGEPTADIMRMLGRSRGFVQRWCYVYRDHGLTAVVPKPPPGRPTKLPPVQHEAFRQRVLAGPKPGVDGDGVCALRGRDLIRILEDEFGVRYELSGVYGLLHRLNLSVLAPRPQHRKSDPVAMRRWVEDAPFLSKNKGANTPASVSMCGSRMKRGSASKAR
jgi:putative transposase